MKNLFQQIFTWVKTTLGVVFDRFKTISVVAVNVTAKLKFIVESEVLDVAVDLIPGNLDNVILDKVRLVIPIVIKKLALVSGFVQDTDSNSEVVDKVISHLKELNPEGRKAFWVMLAAELNVALSDGKLSFSEAVILTQLTYTEFVKNKKK
jgi:hypothetical protein